jgi:hypothetical protein
MVEFFYNAAAATAAVVSKSLRIGLVLSVRYKLILVIRILTH